MSTILFVDPNTYKQKLIVKGTCINVEELKRPVSYKSIVRSLKGRDDEDLENAIAEAVIDLKLRA